MLCEIFLWSGELSWCWVQQCQEENKSRLCEALKLSVGALKLTMFITFLDNYSPPDNGSVEQRSSLGQIQGDTEAACGGGDWGEKWSTLGTQSAHSGNVCTIRAVLGNFAELEVLLCQHQDRGSQNKLSQMSVYLN